MTQEDRQLLLKDLCARLPYGVRVKIFDEDVLLGDSEKGTLDGKMSDDHFVIKCDKYSWIISCDVFKPYLRPMSSMTKEEKYIYRHMLGATLNSEGESIMFVYEEDFSVVMDWLNTRHFDYRGLIEKGLALKAPEGMYEKDI